MNLQIMKQKRADYIDLLENLLKNAVDDQGKPRELTDDEQSDVDLYKSQVDTLSRRIKQAEELEKWRKDNAVPVKTQVDDPTDLNSVQKTQKEEPKRVFSEPKEPEIKGQKFVTFVKALAACKGMTRLAAQFASEELKSPQVAKALSMSSHADGGALVPADYMQEIVEFLRPASVIMSMNPISISFSGSLTVPRMTGGSTASYIGETDDAPVTQPTFGEFTLRERKLAALVPVSNDLLRNSVGGADSMIRDDLVAAIAQKMDAAMIRDTGVANAPKGLRYFAPTANVVSANATVNLANTEADLSKAQAALLNANVRMLRPGWLMAPRTKLYLENLRSTNGDKIYPSVADNMTLRGYPIGVTTQIPYNLGGGSDESEVYLVDFADVVVGQVPEVVVKVSSEAAYVSGGSTKSAFQADMTLIQAIVRHDMNMRHLESVYVLTAVKWA